MKGAEMTAEQGFAFGPKPQESRSPCEAFLLLRNYIECLFLSLQW